MSEQQDAGQLHDHSVLWEHMPVVYDLSWLQQHLLNLSLLVHNSEGEMIETDDSDTASSMPDLVSEGDSDLSDAETVLAKEYPEVD